MKAIEVSFPLMKYPYVEILNARQLTLNLRDKFDRYLFAFFGEGEHRTVLFEYDGCVCRIEQMPAPISKNRIDEWTIAMPTLAVFRLYFEPRHVLHPESVYDVDRALASMLMHAHDEADIIEYLYENGRLGRELLDRPYEFFREITNSVESGDELYRVVQKYQFRLHCETLMKK